MDKDLIVAIFTPTKGSSSTKCAIRGNFGTGYPLSDDLILTSRHVVEPENRDRQAKIRIQWYFDKPTGGEPTGWIPIEKDDLVWTGLVKETLMRP